MTFPPLEAVENGDWVHFQQHTAEELAEIGLTWESLEGYELGDRASQTLTPGFSPVKRK
jgi:hypothetical protein